MQFKMTYISLLLAPTAETVSSFKKKYEKCAICCMSMRRILVLVRKLFQNLFSSSMQILRVWLRTNTIKMSDHEF